VSWQHRAGADIHFLWDVKNSTLSEHISTPTWYAEYWGVEDEWKEALEACDLNPDEVYAEDERRRRQHIGSRGTHCKESLPRS
jgi:hypothetical protein